MEKQIPRRGVYPERAQKQILLFAQNDREWAPQDDILTPDFCCSDSYEL